MKAVRFICEGCAATVYGLGYPRVPASQLCSTCEWMCEQLPDLDEFWAAYTRQRDTGKPLTTP